MYNMKCNLFGGGEKVNIRVKSNIFGYLLFFISVFLFSSILTINTEIIYADSNIEENISQCEDGWARYDDARNEFIYSGGFYSSEHPDYYNGSCHQASQYNSKVCSQYMKFSFVGSKLRIINSYPIDESRNCLISFDNGENFEELLAKDETLQNKSIVYEKEGMEFGNHDVIIKIPYDEQGGIFSFDAIDIDEDGYIVSEFDIPKEIKEETKEEDTASYTENLGDMQDIITALINKEKFESGQTEDELNRKTAKFASIYDNYIINN